MDVESLACPVSIITPESKSLVKRFFEARRAAKLGGTLYGADAAKWPARWFEAASLMQYEVEREEAAAQKAIAQRR